MVTRAVCPVICTAKMAHERTAHLRQPDTNDTPYFKTGSKDEPSRSYIPSLSNIVIVGLSTLVAYQTSYHSVILSWSLHSLLLTAFITSFVYLNNVVPRLAKRRHPSYTTIDVTNWRYTAKREVYTATILLLAWYLTGIWQMWTVLGSFFKGTLAMSVLFCGLFNVIGLL